MTRYADDSDFDALAAQVRSTPKLSDEELRAALNTARAMPSAQNKEPIIEHFLHVALDAALALKGGENDVAVLYQEAVIAVITEVDRFVGSDDSEEMFLESIGLAVAAHLKKTLEDQAMVRASEEAFVRDVRLLSMARTHLRAENGSEPTVETLAATLKWTNEKVGVVYEMLTEAEQIHDADLIDYLDDE